VNAERVYPHDIEAERAALGAILVDSERIHEVSERLKPTDFYRQAHQTIYAAMLRLNEQRKGIDWLTLREALDAGALEEVGGAAYIMALTDGVPRGAHVGEYCRIIRDGSVRRRLQAAGDQAIRDASSAEVEAREALERAERAIYAITERDQRGDLQPASNIVHEAFAVIEKIQEAGRSITGLGSGFLDLDGFTRGFQPGSLIILAARPAMGKSALALNFAHNASLDHDSTTAFYSLEMSKIELMTRMLTAGGRIDAHRMLSGSATAGDMVRLANAMAEIGAARLWIDESSTQTLMSIRGKSRRLKAKQHGLGLVILDYLQLLSSTQRYSNRNEEVGAMSRGLKILAKELDLPLIVLCQLNRQAEARSDGKPKLSDLRESGAIEQDADVVLLLHRPFEYSQEADPAEAQLIIAKNRNGPTGAVRLRWSKEMTRFDNWSDRSDRV